MKKTVLITACMIILAVIVWQLIPKSNGTDKKSISFAKGRYIGQQDNGLPQGQGSLYTANDKLVFRGYWQEGKPYGWGVWYNLDGSVREKRERLEPEQGTYFGVNLDPKNDSIAELVKRLGFNPATYVTFVEFPLKPASLTNLNKFVDEIVPTGGIVLITLLPTNGLDTVTRESCAEFSELCASYENMGINVMVRFAHEMNGSWYPWGQQPISYKAKFRLLAREIHSRTNNTAMLWAPNSGGGYPFSGGTYEAKPGTPEFLELDTNKDNVLSMEDDMYSPYYPGDDVVDWVGLTVYHWGNSYPWLENELPEEMSFINHITGNYNGLGGDQRSVPDFYALFCSDGVHNKPMAVPETAAFYNTQLSGTGTGELAIKQAWWQQVFNVDGETSIKERFPKIKMINWFEVLKEEAEVNNNIVDWRVTRDRDILTDFVNHLRPANLKQQHFMSAQEYREQFIWDSEILGH